MPPNPPVDAIVIALDVGKSVSALHDDNEKTFFELARDCASWIIQRKIISQSADVISLLLIGSDESDNKIAANDYKNICGKFDFQLASWDMLKFMETEVKTTDNDSDWFGALIVSVEILKLYDKFNEVRDKKIVFFSDFTHPVSDDINVVIKNMEKLNIEVTIIGPAHLHSFTDSDDDEPRAKKRKVKKTIERLEGEKMVYNLWRRLPENIIICTFESALKQLCSYAPKTKRINYWNCILDIGDLKINISMAKKTDPKAGKKFSTMCVKPVEQESGENSTAQTGHSVKSSETVPTKRDKVMHYKHEMGEGKEFSEVEVQPEDTVEGFRYGTTIIPFTEEDKSAMEYKSGPKCFSIIGFTSITSVPYYLLSGECSYVVVPRAKDKNAEVALSALVQGMKKAECLAIVRRVYSDNCGLSLGILHPSIEEIVCDETGDVSYREYLLFVELAFEDDVKYIDFPSLEKFSEEITEKQYEVVDNLIDGMNLMKADKGLRGEPCEAFDLSSLHDFKEQFFHYCVIQKGLYPEKPLPTSLPPYIENITKAPKAVEEKCKSLVKDIKAHFKVELVKHKSEKSDSMDFKRVQRSSSSGDIDKEKRGEASDSHKHFSEEAIKEEKHPILRDWMRLFGKDFPADEDLDQFFNKIVSDIEIDPFNVTKFFRQVITDIRNKYLKVIPNEFNSWMTRFKEYTREKSEIEAELWEVIVKENLGLISKKENPHSDITEEEAEEFLCDYKKEQSSFERDEADISRPGINLPNRFLQELEKEESYTYNYQFLRTRVEQNDMTSNGAHFEMTSPPPPATSENPSSAATTPPQTIVIKGRRYRQRQLGPAPFASFEDLSDELDSPPETARIPLPGIKEDPSSQLQSPNTPLPQLIELNITEKEEQCLKESLTSSLDTPAPPRIDISRASSSSQHEDSITSSPERENGTHNLGYKEDGTVDLRSSTEELDYIQEPGTVHESEEKRKREKMMRRQQQVRDFGDTQSQHEFIERKDSSCSVMSDVGLLYIGGRTSRLSSIGSAASGGSAASAGSHLSGRSTRSPSPHKMLLETSFCGSKPMLSQNVDSETVFSFVAIVEKAASRPPSRLRSRSPSPHKMLLETSFCGTKQILPQEVDVAKVLPKANKKDDSKTSPTVVIETVIEQRKTAKEEAPPPQLVIKAEEKERAENSEKLKPLKTKRTENAAESSGKAKPFALPKKPAIKPKKIISIRDIPGDEIYIPLKGPELDLEEIIRNASPNVQKKIEKPKSSDEVFISLHSPPKSSTEKGKKDSTASSTPKSSKAKVSHKTSSQKVPEKGTKTSSREKHPAVKQEPKKREYEICEDGSIFIPLHSPDENKRSNNFESEIKRVDEELQKAREAAEKRMKEEEEETQRKPDTLDLTDSGSHKSRLSQAYASGKSEVPSGGSRTPSPGSTLSRKSSFASLFRKSDIFSSSDSQTTSTARKKSGTFSNILKEASDGLRERSRSRSKSKERQPQSSTSVRSPSGKKNVFTNLFAKKKADLKPGSGKENDQLPSRLDLQFTFAAGTESTKVFDEGDYIIIPLRDPADPPDAPDYESSQILPSSDKLDHDDERPSSPMVILEKRESPTVLSKSGEVEGESVEVVKASKSSSKNSLEAVAKSLRSSSDNADPGKRSSQAGFEGECEGRTKPFAAASNRSQSFDEAETLQQSTRERTPTTLECRAVRRDVSDADFEYKNSMKDGSREEENRVDGPWLQHDSSLEIEEKGSKEEILPVTANDVRKLKLPPEPGDLDDDHERKGLVYQESFEDELPYVPTTLPLERSVGVPIVPVKHRVSEIKTCSIERPRSTTPINPTALEDYVSAKETVSVTAEEKMKISLPRDNSITSKSKSPTRCSGKGKTWFEFAEAGLQSPRDYRKSSLRTTPSPPPLPPRSSPPSVLSSSAPPTTTSWINFEELPEKRKLPKRITTIPPLRGSTDGSDKSGTSVGGGVVYSYVSPEDCQCECHDQNASHGKESDHERGRRNDLMPEFESNGEFIKKGFVTKKKTSKPEEINEKSGCKDCESGIHATGDRDTEETPLLGVNSDEEEDYVSGKPSSLTRSGGNLDLDITSHLSDSSCDYGSHEGLHEVEHNYQLKDAKPFSMDLEVDSNHSSLLSQEAWSSPEDVGNHLQH